MATTSDAVWREYLSTIDERLARFRAMPTELGAGLAGGSKPSTCTSIARIQALSAIAAELDALLEKSEWLERERYDLQLLFAGGPEARQRVGANGSLGAPGRPSGA